jgi:hypothetical protein
MYTIVRWDNNQSLGTYEDLATAKRQCRKLGHTGKPYGNTYPPIARVDDENGTVYNPRFVVGKHDHLQTRLIDKPDTKIDRGIAAAHNARTQLKHWDWQRKP